MTGQELPKRPRKYEDMTEFDGWVSDCFQLIKEAEGPEQAKAWAANQYKEYSKEKAEKKRRENRNFTQVYPDGWQRLQVLIRDNSNAARVYAFFAENMGPDGTLCASRGTIAEAMDITERTVSRHVKYLEEVGAVFVLKIGSANVYCLRPEEVWKSFDNAKPYAPFNTRTLVGKSENRLVKKRLATILGGKVPEQKDWLDDLDEDPDEHITIAAE